MNKSGIMALTRTNEDSPVNGIGTETKNGFRIIDSHIIQDAVVAGEQIKYFYSRPTTSTEFPDEQTRLAVTCVTYFQTYSYCQGSSKCALQRRTCAHTSLSNLRTIS
jgi:hypothetical protein